MDKFKLLYKNKIVIEKGNSECSDKYIAAIISNIADLGFVLSREIINVLRTNKTEYVINFYKELLSNIKKEIGFREYNPLYPNFPQQLAELDDYELFINAIFHFVSGGEKLSYYEKQERFPLMDDVEYKILELGTIDDYKNNFINILSSKTSVSERNKNFVSWFINEHTDLALESMPEMIPLKENVCIAASLLYDKGVEADIISKYVKTATDVLRIMAFMSEGDITLKDVCKFKSFKRRERKFILGLLEGINPKLEDMYHYKGRWIVAGERLHPGDFAKVYPDTYKAFTALRENKKITTFKGQVEKLIKQEKIDKAIDLLKERPGELVRMLDRLLVIIGTDLRKLDHLGRAFKECAVKVEATVLWQAREHFANRPKMKPIRAFFPKGSSYNMYVRENDLKPIRKEVCLTVAYLCKEALIEKYSQKEALGNVYVAPELAKFAIPFSQRSASKALKTITRGSRIKIDEKTSVIRAFIHWKDWKKGEGTDVDLSASILDKNFTKMMDISYFNLSETQLNCYHSGDVRFAPEGASEFIDLDLEKLEKSNAGYVIFSVNSYSRVDFANIPECFFGIMERQEANSGEVYEPKTVKDKFDLTSESTMAVTMIYDVDNREFIWVDSVFKANMHMPNNVYNNISGVIAFAKVMTELNKPNMYDLFMVNGEARGKIVYDIEESDTAFVLEKSKNEDDEAENNRIEITPYDIEEIVGNYL